MPALKSSLACLAIALGLCSPALAQKSPPTTGAMGYPKNQNTGDLASYYGMTPNFANYGLSGAYPYFGGYGYSGYGPGPQFGPLPAVPPGPGATQMKKTPAAPTVRPRTPPTRPSSPGDATSKSVARPRKGL